jgi:hypothetical protein
MQLSNLTPIKSEDFPEESRETVSKLAFILNRFMDEVVTLSQGNIDFENTTQEFRQFEVTVNENGVPTQPLQLRTQKVSPLGFQIIFAQNQVNPLGYPTSAPFISFTPRGNGVVDINNIRGLLANQRYFIRIIVY